MADAIASGCRPSGSRTLASDSHGRVFTQRKRGANVTFGCLYSVGRKWRLDSPGDGRLPTDPKTLELRSPSVGYTQATQGVDTLRTEVVAKNLRDGRDLHRHAATSGVPGPESATSVSDLVAKRSASVAWIGRAYSLATGASLLQVERIDSRGYTVLDEGDGIDPHSLTLSGSLLHWTVDAQPRAARLY